MWRRCETQVQRENEVTNGSVMRDLTIRGRREMIDKVKDVVQTIVQTRKADIITTLQSSRDGFEKVSVPNDKVGLVIGKNGNIIKDIQMRTKAYIQIPGKPVEGSNPPVR